MRPRQQLGVEAALKVTTEIGRFSIYFGAGNGKSAAALRVVLRPFGLGVASNQKLFGYFDRWDWEQSAHSEFFTEAATLPYRRVSPGGDAKDYSVLFPLCSP